MYEAPTGARHSFGGTLADTLLESKDSSRLRLRLIGTSRVVEMPGGAQSWFEPDGSRWRLQKMTDPFKNGTADLNWVQVAYETNPETLNPVWTITDSASRTHTVEFTSRSYDGDVRQSVEKLTLATFDGPATWTLAYLTTSVARPCATFDGTSEIAETSAVPLLERIIPPTGNAYTFTYDAGAQPACDEWPGQVQTITLPTLGKIAYDWGRFQLPAGSASEPYLQQSQGVRVRKLYEQRWDGAQDRWADVEVGRWTYTPALDRPYDAYGNDTPRELATTIRNPAGNETVYYFNVLPVLTGTASRPSEYGLPYSPIKTDGAGRFQAVSIYQGLATGTPVRSSFVRYEMDSGSSTTPSNERNARVVSSRTRYDQDAANFVDTDLSGYAGHGLYSTTTVSGSFGPTRVATATYVAATSDLWIIGRTLEVTITEAGATTRQSLCYDSATGALTRRRVVANIINEPDESVDPPASRDVVDLFTYTTASRGNPATHRIFGGDLGTLPNGDICEATESLLGLPAVYLKHTYSPAGALSSSTYATPSTGTSLSFKSVDQDIDTDSGLVSASRDTAGNATTYNYDSLGRLESITTPGEAATTVTYTPATLAGSSYSPATVSTYRNGELRSVESQDQFGRVVRERQRTHDGQWSIRGHAYDADGTLSWTSSFEALPSETSDLAFSPARKTTYTVYDALGRPAIITGSDGSRTTTSYAGRGVREVTVTQRETSTIERARTERYDHHGRLIYVGAPESPATYYSYDVGGHLSRVEMKDGSTLLQERTFVYDGRGFLRSEKHPESGESHYEYDARGRVIARKHKDGGGAVVTDATFTYEAAERPDSVYDGSGQEVKHFTYLASGSGKGKLWTAVRHNRHATLGDIVVTDTYEYDTNGRVDAKTTSVIGGPAVRTDFTYHSEGGVETIAYPSCTTCINGAPERTVTNTYAHGFRTAVDDGHESSASFTYHPNGLLHRVNRMLGATAGPSWTQTMEQDSAGVLTTGIARPGEIKVSGFCQDFSWQAHPESIATSGPFTLSAAASGATTYQWFERVNGRDTQLDGRTDATLAMNTTSTRQFFVRARNGTCSSDSETATVTYTPCATPDSTINTTAQVDPMQRFTALVADAGAGAAYTWSVTNGTLVSGQGTSSIQVDAGCSGVVSINVTVAACGTTSVPGEIQIPIVPPAITVSSRPSTMAVNSSGSAAIVTIPGAAYHWSITNGTFTSVNTQPSVQFTSDCDTVELVVTATLDCGAFDTESITIPVTGAPTADISLTNMTIDQGFPATINLALTGTGPWTVRWSDNVQTVTPPASRTVTPVRTRRYAITDVSDGNCTRPADDDILVHVIPPPPVNVTASANGTTSIAVSWAFAGVAADRYRVERRSPGGSFVMLGETLQTSWTDATVATNSSYQYRVRTITQSADGTEMSPPSNADVATTVVFTDDPLVAGAELKASHLTELRAATNALRSLAGLAAIAWTNPDLTGQLAMAIHILELRNAINEARTDSDINLPANAFSDPAIEPGDLIRAVHLQDLRGGVR